MSRSFSAGRAATCLAALGLALTACDSATEAPLEPEAILASHSGLPVSHSPVFTLPDFEVAGTSKLVRRLNGVNYTLSTTGLEHGHAYTLWVVIFNVPANCGVPNECAPDDVVNDAARPDLLYGGGTVAGASGRATVAGSRGVGDDDGSINAPVGLPAYGLENPLGAEIHLAVHDHGPVIAAFMPDMIQTIDGGCTDAGVPAAGVPSPWNDHAFGRRGPNTCTTIQASVHRP